MEAVSLNMDTFNKNLFDYIEIIYRRKWMLIVPLVASTIAGIVIGYGLPAYYRSTTLILVEQQQVPQAYVTPTDITPVEKRLSTISQQIMSRTNLEKIIDNFNLYKGDKKQIFKDPLMPLLKYVNLWQDKAPAREDIIEQMRKDIEVKVIEGSGKKGGDAFSVSYTAQDPHVAMQVANTLASFFIDENLKIREQYAEGTSEFLVSELERAKQELEEQEKVLRRFKEEHMGSLPGQMDANLRTLDRLQMELQTVSEALKNAEDRKNLLEAQLSPGLKGLTAAPTSLEAEIERLKTELANLLSVYKENYPDILIIKNRIKEIETQMATKKESYAQQHEQSAPQDMTAQNMNIYADLAAIKSRIATLREREINIRKHIKGYEKRVEETPAHEQKLADISRDYDMSLKNYQSLLEKKLSARLAENMEKRQKGERFRIIDPANLPEKPYKPDRFRIILMGMMAGLGAGMGLVFFFESMNPAFRKPEDLLGVISQPLLATIPLFPANTMRKQVARFMVIRGKKK